MTKPPRTASEGGESNDGGRVAASDALKPSENSRWFAGIDSSVRHAAAPCDQLETETAFPGARAIRRAARVPLGCDPLRPSRRMRPHRREYPLVYVSRQAAARVVPCSCESPYWMAAHSTLPSFVLLTSLRMGTAAFLFIVSRMSKPIVDGSCPSEPISTNT